MAWFKKNRPGDTRDDNTEKRGPSGPASDMTPDNFVYPSNEQPSPEEIFVYDPGEADLPPESQEAPDDPDQGDAFYEAASADVTEDTKEMKSKRKKGAPLTSLEERYAKHYEAERKVLERNIKRVAAVILAMFIGLMSYLGYFQVTRAESLRTDAGNRRNAEERNKVLRGTIFDRRGRVLSKSVLHEDGSQTRDYPGGTAFGNILGYVSQKYSVTGLEASMDQVLSKQPGVESLFTMDFLVSLINPEQGVTKKQVGQSLHVTLDSGLQNAAYKALNGRKGSVVALNPSTGEILAMVSSPGFSAQDLDSVMKKVNSDKAYAAGAPLLNRTIQSVFAPGSTMKAVTVASGLTHLTDLKERSFEDKGVIEFPDGSKINNFNNNVYGKMTLQSAFTNSSNYVFGNIGLELTNAQLRATAEAFGFNEAVKMQGMSARRSVFPSLPDYSRGDKALTAIGQGAVAATPLQMAMVASALANDGKLAEPYLISKITDKDERIVSSAQPAQGRQAVSADVAKTVRELMIGNVRSGGSSYRSLDHLDAAGKTGTAQFEVAGGTRVNAWFIGFAPRVDPKIAFAVCVEDLEDVRENTGAQQAIPVARDILTYWLSR